MSKQEYLKISTDSVLKAEVEQILKPLGIDVNYAVNIFLNLVKAHRGIPFELRLPLEFNQATIDSIIDSQNNIGVTTFDSYEEWSKHLQDNINETD